MMKDKKSLVLTGGPVSFEGAVSIEVTPNGVHPWRIPVIHRDLFDPKLVKMASAPAGVRLTFISNTSSVILGITPPLVETDPPCVFDLLVDGKLHQRVVPSIESNVVNFMDLPVGEHLLELYLPSQYMAFAVRGLQIDADATVQRWDEHRPRIVLYGSSITHCRHAAGPSVTWPALVAQRFNLHLTSLGYGGACHLDPMVGRMIRDLPADYIGLKLGINMMILASVSDRLFGPLVTGMVKTIRDGHPETPLVIISPICHPPSETTENTAGMTLQNMRYRLAEVCEVLRGNGDSHLHYVNGLSLMGPEDIHLYADGLHPSSEGYHFLAKGWIREVAPKLGLA